jgi:hypothetical protein
LEAALSAMVSLRSAQLAFFRDPFAPLVQIRDPIFDLTILTLWKEPGYLVSPVRCILIMPGWPIFHVLSDAKLVG